MAFFADNDMIVRSDLYCLGYLNNDARHFNVRARWVESPPGLIVHQADRDRTEQAFTP